MIFTEMLDSHVVGTAVWPGPIVGYKLFRQRKDGSLGSLFIDRKLRLCVREWWYVAQNIPTPGYAVRPGWHICSKKERAASVQEGPSLVQG